MAALSPSLRQLANEVAPGFPRKGSSDGWIADENHPPHSDHQPDENDLVHAIDIDIDGINYSPDAVLVAALTDPRTKYCIFKAKLYYPDGTIRDNSGHFGHIHISGKYGTQYENDTAPWFDPQPLPQEEPMARAVKGHREATVYIIEGTGPALEFADPATYNECAMAYGIKSVQTIDQDAFDLLKKAIGTKFVA